MSDTENSQSWHTMSVVYVMWDWAMSKVNSRTSCQWLDAVTRSLPISVARKGCCSLGSIIHKSLCCVRPDWCTVRPFSITSDVISYSLPMKLTACLGGKLQHVIPSLTEDILSSVEQSLITKRAMTDHHLRATINHLKTMIDQLMGNHWSIWALIDHLMSNDWSINEQSSIT